MDPTLDGTPDQVMTWLKDNFNRHAKQGKTPFGNYFDMIIIKYINKYYYPHLPNNVCLFII